MQPPRWLQMQNGRSVTVKYQPPVEPRLKYIGLLILCFFVPGSYNGEGAVPLSDREYHSQIY